MSGAAADPFEAGDMVEIHGLQAAAEHNGKAGTIVGFNLDKGRWNVRIKGRKKPLGLKPGNLRRMSGQSLSELRSAADTRGRQKVTRRFNDGSLLRCAVQEKDETGDEYPNQAAICRAKLAAGSDPNSCNHIGQTALHVAAIWGAMGVGRALVEAGADVNRRNNLNRGTPLMCAARRDQMEFAQMLLEHGADPMLQDEGGSVAYQLASDPALRELLGGPSGRLTEAVAAGDLAGVEQLASQYPELVGAKDGEGDTPIVVAIQRGHWDIALWFARHEMMAKLFVDQPSGSKGLRPLHLAARARRRELVAALLKSGADPNRRSIRRNEYTAGTFDIADPGTGQKRAVSAEHRTPLFECVENGDAAIGRLLIDGEPGVSILEFGPY
jgi:ankyrin repeat protein